MYKGGEIDGLGDLVTKVHLCLTTITGMHSPTSAFGGWEGAV